MFKEIAQAVMLVAGSVRAKDDKNLANAEQGIADEEAAADLWEDNAAANKSIQETNLQNAIRTGYRVGILNVQRGQAAKIAAAAGLSLGQQKLKALGAVNANAAAAGSIGASVDAVASDIEMRAGMADAGIVEDRRVTNENYDNELTGILQAGEDAIVAPQTVSTRRPRKPRIIGNGEAIGSALIQWGGKYASDFMSLGLGSKPAPTNFGSIYNGAAGTTQAIDNTGMI